MIRSGLERGRRNLGSRWNFYANFIGRGLFFVLFWKWPSSLASGCIYSGSTKICFHFFLSTCIREKKSEYFFCRCVNLKFHESFASVYIFYARACLWASISMFYEFLSGDKNLFNFCSFPGISVLPYSRIFLWT